MTCRLVSVAQSIAQGGGRECDGGAVELQRLDQLTGRLRWNPREPPPKLVKPRKTKGNQRHKERHQMLFGLVFA